MNVQYSSSSQCDGAMSVGKFRRALGKYRGVGHACIDACRLRRCMPEPALQRQLSHACFPHAGGVGMPQRMR